MTTTDTASHTFLHSQWAETPPKERMASFRLLPLADAQEFYRELSTRHQYEIVSFLPEREQTVWMRLLAPDDAADLLQEAPEHDRPRLLQLLDQITRDDVHALL
jgi:magnesium transporter